MDDNIGWTDVLIVGAGPAGLATAVELADRGIEVLVVDRRPDSSDHPRATALTAETMDTLRRWGVESEVHRAGFPSEHAMSIRPCLVGPELVLVPFPDHVWTCAQDRLEPIIAERARTAGAVTRYGCEVVHTQAGEDGVVATVEGLDGRPSTNVRARYLVGADGAHSAVRQENGILMTRIQEFGSWLSILFHAPLREFTGPSPCMVYGIGDPSTGGVISPTDATDRWIRGIGWFPERGERLVDYDTSRCIDIVRSAVGVEDLPVAIADVRAFRMVAGIADRYVAGRVAVAGDAAHVVTPSTGMGLNLALHDGVALGRALAHTIEGHESPRALEVYERERRPLAERLLESELAPA
jgi:2-polyprenyl-6-methoxyphenol hydroxylase-like FAD-dependent oxidoreductase